MSRESNLIDVLILGNTLTGICLANLLKGTLGEACQVMILDVSGDEGILQDQARYASLELEIPIVNGIIKSKARKHEDTDQNYTKIFIDEKMNVSHVENINVFPFGHIYDSNEIKNWFTELNSLSKRVPPFAATYALNSSVSKELEKILDQTNVRDHMHKFIKSDEGRRAIEEMIWELCGVPANKVSMLFFLWIRNRSRMSLRNKKSFKDNITYKVLTIKKKDNSIFVETDKENFICKILAMAMKPSQVKDINIARELFDNKRELDIISRMFHGVRRGFFVDYLRPFWKEKGFSGEIYSLSGIIRSSVDETVNFDNDVNFIKVYTISGHLRVEEKDESVKSISKFRNDVIQQLVSCFGQDAATPLHYIEEMYDFIDIPQLGDFSELLKLLSFSDKNKLIEWACLDIYNNCDIDTALLAAHKAYLNITYILRPQAINYDDLVENSPKTILSESKFLDDLKNFLLRSINYKTASIVIVTSAVFIFLRYFYKGGK